VIRPIYRFNDSNFTCRAVALREGGTRRSEAQPVVEKLLRSTVCMFLS